MKKTYLIVFDTETCNGIFDEDTQKLDLTQSLVYDIGWQVVDLHHNVYERRSFVIYETFVGMADVMTSAYYANKIPRYREEIENGSRLLRRYSTVRKIFLEDLYNYDTNIVCAHNASFDYRAINNTERYLTKSFFRYFLPYGVEIWDTLKMARQTFAKEERYIKFCEDNNYMTKHSVPRPRLTAEILYRYMIKDTDFEESHTGLEDVEIETEILWRIIDKHKKIERRLWEN